MQTGRNDPCPCGSRKKYKKCCLEKDQLAEQKGLPPPSGLDAEALLSDPWQAELVPLPTSSQDDPDARPAVLLVAAGGVPLHVDVVAHPPAGPDEVARLLADALRKAAATVGGMPAQVDVRHDAVADVLEELLGGEGVVVDTAASMAALDIVAADVMQRLGLELSPAPAFSVAPTWSAWGLPDRQVAELFRACAAFWRAAPWRWVDNLQTLELETAQGGEWTVRVLGNGGEEFGLALYEDFDDFLAFVEAAHPGDAFEAVMRAVLSITCEPGRELPRGMREDVASRGWEVADPDAYPLLKALNTPGGGVTRRQAEELAAALRAVPRFVERHRDVLAGDDELRFTDGTLAVPGELEGALEWTDPDTGVRLRYQGRPPLGPARGMP